MLPVDWEGVVGAVSPPQLSRGTRDGVLLAVNGRPIASRALGFALEECYRGSLERGRYPMAVLDLAVDPAAIDVNVHPTKREVKFRDEGAVFTLLQRAVRAALVGAEAPRLPVSAPAGPLPGPWLAPVQVEMHEAAPHLAPMAAAAGNGFLRPVGQVMDGYLVAEGAEGLILVDQHAAHERVLYNRFRARLDAGSTSSQALLLPLTVELDAATAAALPGKTAELGSLGFEVEAFGPRTARILAGPAETPPGRLEDAFREVLAGLRGNSMEEALASLACHSAVRFGDQLDPSEQRRLIDELGSTTPDATCPHGRPTRLLIPWQDLRRHFRRNY
jgi:DNA mismatch repair protein MutL